MFEVETCSILKGFGYAESVGLLKEIPDKRDGSWPFLFIMSIGDEDSRMPGQVCYKKVGATPSGSNVDIDFSIVSAICCMRSVLRRLAWMYSTAGMSLA